MIIAGPANEENYEASREYSREKDALDPLRAFRNRFHFPETDSGEDAVYFTGNSLGLQPKTTKDYVDQELADWARLAVEGHFEAAHPWLPYHEFLTEKMAEVVGAKPIETVVMNSLTVNLHLLMVSFYRPSKERFKIMIEGKAFPSDQYAVKSQLAFHGIDPAEGLIEVTPRTGETWLRTEDIVAAIKEHGESLALVMFGGVNYYTGQAFDLDSISEAGHSVGAVVGFDLAHAAGNIHLRLHETGADFACWCSYKYLNSGPGGVAGVFVHERHKANFDLPRFSGWWGHDKDSRFQMGPDFKAIEGAEGWQISNPPIFQMAALMASLEIFSEAGMAKLSAKSKDLTGYLEFLLDDIGDERISVITPRDPNQRGCQLSIRVDGADRSLFERLSGQEVFADWREPDVIRVAPVPLYNSFEDVFRFSERLRKALGE
ncbi:MAG: kynureninase [Acidobacteria bacterium]|nr:MAG: kynureninase [Acidobacteriota bacterium]REK02071.1 MAG: kynureninase [Acidobacteriota bacterium]REK15029.1 MAG: kynureninase [Acidobacteriota bacterium]REK45743.1 MAG: kynureninase [Acidobacteriota bacterium]